MLRGHATYYLCVTCAVICCIKVGKSSSWRLEEGGWFSLSCGKIRSNYISWLLDPSRVPWARFQLFAYLLVPSGPSQQNVYGQSFSPDNAFPSRRSVRWWRPLTFRSLTCIKREFLVPDTTLEPNLTISKRTPAS